MKINYTLLSIAITAIGFATNANAQTSVKVPASVTFITPLSIVKTADMSFGTIALTPGQTGRIRIDPSGATDIENATLRTGALAPAQFSIAGTPNSEFTIGLPTNQIFLESATSGATPNISLSGFTIPGVVAPAGRSMGTMVALPVSYQRNIGPTGTFMLTVGAELTTPATGVVPAAYYAPNDGLEVSVNYL